MNEAIIIFTRVPVAGKTKTRLESLFLPEECAEIHSCFLKDIKKCCENTGRDCFVFYTPYGKKNILYSLLGKDKKYVLQKGGNLGIRMHNAIEYVLKSGYDSCVLIGSDIPELESSDLVKAFDVLRRNDLVLGPTTDYGYYLIGMKKPDIKVFDNQIYGYGSVLKNTIEAVKTADLSYNLIKAYADIDEPEDVFNLKKRFDMKEYDENKYTAKYVEYLVKEYEDRWIESADCGTM
ncbi:TIGR04282 family arsenosugar biosynthesis glycosyltransferase [Proteocatella sphenisci]|uniref:TIGR04282 family arsenosugar biosynthesis glycosyltransferase n=1 Tax=Proteocatella sphenisci TaxID=181070 RepID=UPI00048B895C|nr:TIGR04282 family arsenosugar biosynthesis glycosyltransferase [Proteocatella sphenisci]